MKKLIKSTGMNMLEFSQYLGIPYRTVQNWVLGQREPSAWVVELIKYKLEKEHIIDEKKMNLSLRK